MGIFVTNLLPIIVATVIGMMIGAALTLLVDRKWKRNVKGISNLMHEGAEVQARLENRGERREERGNFFAELKELQFDNLQFTISNTEHPNDQTTNTQTTKQPNDQTPNTRPCILVVDDNHDALMFLQQSLSNEFRVLVASNGSEALRVLKGGDDVCIVVSDVMMPVMDGIELVRHIRNDTKYAHIPVILLTAMDGEQNIVAGLEEGVADYVTKPFSMNVLRLRIRKILEWQKAVHEGHESGDSINQGDSLKRDSIKRGIEIEPSELAVSSLDEELIQRVINNIEANISNSSYSVAQLSSDVGMTRGHLYKKLIAITGKSPLEFVSIIKLKRGKSLMDQGKTNISEVADMVGLSAKQFAHYFKKMYGETPSEYLRKKRSGKSPLTPANSR
ncbi:MAG: DNA-binding response regulator [Prevotella sp.]|nr:DNA-binding response regulator [Prevotella sp.]